MPIIEDYEVLVTTEVTIKTSSGRIVEEFSSTDYGKASSSHGSNLVTRVKALSARTNERVIRHVVVAEQNELERLANGN